VDRSAYTRQTRGHHNGRGRLGVVIHEYHEPYATRAANESLSDAHNGFESCNAHALGGVLVRNWQGQ
jgi:hypothetical protein